MLRVRLGKGMTNFLVYVRPKVLARRDERRRIEKLKQNRQEESQWSPNIWGYLQAILFGNGHGTEHGGQSQEESIDPSVAIASIRNTDEVMAEYTACKANASPVPPSLPALDESHSVKFNQQEECPDSSVYGSDVISSSLHGQGEASEERRCAVDFDRESSKTSQQKGASQASCNLLGEHVLEDQHVEDKGGTADAAWTTHTENETDGLVAQTSIRFAFSDIDNGKGKSLPIQAALEPETGERQNLASAVEWEEGVEVAFSPSEPLPRRDYRQYLLPSSR